MLVESYLLYDVCCSVFGFCSLLCVCCLLLVVGRGALFVVGGLTCVVRRVLYVVCFCCVSVVVWRFLVVVRSLL